MAKVERITDTRGNPPLRVTRRKARRTSSRRTVAACITIRCGDCEEKLEIHPDVEPTGDPSQNCLEINGVSGTLFQWRKVFLPLLGIDNPDDVSVSQAPSPTP